jgi:hypothetical protein
MTDESLRYPVGRFSMPGTLTPAQRAEAIEVLAAFPAQFRAAVQGLDAAQLDTPYRDGGWSVRQVVHHVPESHINAYCRLKFALTEENPTIKPYDEVRWSGFADQAVAPIEASLQIVDGIHARFVTIWRLLTSAQFARTLQHPENGPMTLDDLLGMYAWHSRHHLAHITSLRQRKGW